MKTKLNSNRMVNAVSLLLVTGFLVTSLASYFVSRASLRSSIANNELPLTSDNIYSEIQRDLIRPVFISSLMATNTFLRNWVIDGEKDRKQIAEYLDDIRVKYHTVTSFFVSDKTLNYYYAGGLLKTVSPKEERDKWYFRVRAMKDLYEINVDPDMANKDTITVFINYKVFDYDGNFIGAIGVGLTVDFVKKLMETYNRKYGRNIYFIERNGVVKFFSSASDTFQKNVFTESTSPVFREKFEETLKNSGEFLSYRRSGELVHANIRYISEFKLYLIVEQPERDKTRQIFSALIMNLSICAVITLVVLFLVKRTIRNYQERIKTLEGIIPICMHCKQIRDEHGTWHSLEHFISERSDARFSHGICPNCIDKHYGD
jgi:hypothetical protein